MFSLLAFFPSLFNIAQKIAVCTHKFSTKQNQLFQVGTATQKDISESPVICKLTVNGPNSSAAVAVKLIEKLLME